MEQATELTEQLTEKSTELTEQLTEKTLRDAIKNKENVHTETGWINYNTVKKALDLIKTTHCVVTNVFSESRVPINAIVVRDETKYSAEKEVRVEKKYDMLTIAYGYSPDKPCGYYRLILGGQERAT